jgi:hypothetical protein
LRPHQPRLLALQAVKDATAGGSGFWSCCSKRGIEIGHAWMLVVPRAANPCRAAPAFAGRNTMSALGKLLAGTQSCPCSGGTRWRNAGSP